MPQVIRPDVTTATTSWVGNHTAINSLSRNDATFCYGNNNSNGAFIEVGLQNPVTPIAAGDILVRFRCAKVSSGSVNGAGGTVTLTPRVYVGGTIVFTSAAVTTTGVWTEYEFTLDAALVADLADMRVRFTQSGSGGGGNARGGAVSWLEVEVPDIYVPPAGPKAKIWTGSAWTEASPKIWNGSTWVSATSKVWNGSSWEL